jgi:uroporphyrinogen-III decarboxylase
MAMTGKSRIAAAMRHQPVDRVPVMCQLALGHYFRNLPTPAMEIWHSTEGFGKALLALQQRYSFDGILINLPGRDPRWQSHIRRIESRGSGKVIHWANGWHTVCPADDNPHNFRADGREFCVSFDEVDPGSLFYVEPHDLGGLKYPHAWGFSPDRPRQDRFFPPWHYDTIDFVRERAGEEISIHGEIFSPFTQFLDLLGCPSALVALLDDPEKSKACLDALARGAIVLGSGQAAHGVDAILMSSAYAGAGFISPQHYRDFVLPCERRVIEGIKAVHDIPVYTHTCGRIGDRLELLAETGTDGIDTLDPPPLGNVELADAKRRIGKRLFIKGNLDPVNILLHGTPDQVLENALRCIAAGSPGGGYILSSACSVPPHAPPENVLMLSAAVHDAAGRTAGRQD